MIKNLYHKVRRFFHIKAIVFICLASLSLTSQSQIGGNNTYDFLSLTSSARAVALGGESIAIKDYDLGLVNHNPSLLNENMHNHFCLNYSNYLSDINFGYLAYSRSYGKFGNFALGLQYINYGDFTQADEYGTITGNFTASEYAFGLSWSKEIDSLFSAGISLKPIYSAFEKYHSFGIATDFGVTYQSKDKNFVATALVRSLGTQLTTYVGEDLERIPTEIMLGLSNKLKHAPFRISMTIRHLEKFDLSTNPDQTREVITFMDQAVDFTDKLFRHVVFGVEFTPNEKFYLRLGYNHQIRKDLKLEGLGGFTGFSFGAGLKISKFRINYARATYHISGASNLISISTNFSDFL